jgi:hypothetical protein
MLTLMLAAATVVSLTTTIVITAAATAAMTLRPPPNPQPWNYSRLTRAIAMEPHTPIRASRCRLLNPSGSVSGDDGE